MGASGSFDNGGIIALSSECTKDEIEGPPTIKLDITAETNDHFHTMACTIGRRKQARDILSESPHVLIVKGCRWKKNETPNPDMADKWFHLSLEVEEGKMVAVGEIIRQSKLNMSYREQYAKPATVSDGVIFVNVDYCITASDGKIATTKLMGCIAKEELKTPWEDTDVGDEVAGMWVSKIPHFLPGEKLKPEYILMMRWWRDVERTLDRAVLTAGDNDARVDLIASLSNEAAAYRRFVNSQDPLYSEEASQWKSAAHSAAHKIVHSVVDSFCSACESLLTSARPRNPNEVQYRLQEVKKSLQKQFEDEIFNLADTLGAMEKKAWVNFENRFNQRGSYPHRSFSSLDEEDDSTIVCGTAPDNIPTALSRSVDQNKASQPHAVEVTAVSVPKRNTSGDDINRYTGKKRLGPRSSFTTDNGTRSSYDSTGPIPIGQAGVLRPRLKQAHSLDSIPTTAPAAAPIITRSASSPLTLVGNASKKRQYLRMTKILEIRRSKLNRQQGATFVSRARIAFEQVLFEEVIMTRMRNYLDRTLVILEEKWEHRHTQELETIQLAQSKERANVASSGNASVSSLEDLKERHEAQKFKVKDSFRVYCKEQREGFDRGARRTLLELESRIQSLRATNKKAEFSSTGAEKFKAICVVYDLLRS